MAPAACAISSLPEDEEMRRDRPEQLDKGARAIPLFVLALLVVASGPAHAEARGRKTVRSLQELRQDRVVRQRWDLSCGSAALSTLLTYDVGDPVREEEIIETMLRRADPVKIRARQGFSLLDLKRYAVSRGHEADGYGRLDIAQLAKLAPAIVPTVMAGNNHFVVVRGIRDGHVIIADPGFGNRTMTVAAFEEVWPKRIAFVVRPKKGEGASPVRAKPAIVPPPVVREAVRVLQ